MKFSITKEELPKTRLGKIRRFMLASLVEEKTKKLAGKNNRVMVMKTIKLDRPNPRINNTTDVIIV